MSYNTAYESYRIKGKDLQMEEAYKFVECLRSTFSKSFILTKASLNNDIHDKIDFYIDDDPVDIKIANNDTMFTLTVISNYYKENYFEKAKCKYLLFSNNNYFYYVLLDSLKEWVKKENPVYHLTKNFNENSKYIILKHDDLINIDKTLIIKKHIK